MTSVEKNLNDEEKHTIHISILQKFKMCRRTQTGTHTHSRTHICEKKKVESELRTDALEAVSQRYNICGSFRNFIVHAIRVKYF